jgi:hypothetical protein
MLQSSAKDAARDNHDQQNHEHGRQQSAESESSVKANQRKAQQAEPQMAPHPRLRAAKPPHWHFFSRGQQACEQHASGADNSERESYGAAAARSRGGASGVNDVDGRRGAQTHERHGEPSSMCAVDAQERLHF